MQINKQTNKIRAFSIHDSGKGDHALLSGNNKQVGQLVALDDGRILGKVGITVVTVPPEDTCDAALVELRRPIAEFALSVQDQNGSTVQLVDVPLRTVQKGQTVGKFDRNFGQDVSLGVVMHPNYDKYHDGVIIDCIAIGIGDPDNTGGSRAIHVKGESGKLVTTVPCCDNCHIVQPIGTLVAVERVPRTDDGRSDEYSIAVPIERTLRRLSDTAYYEGKEVRIITHHTRQT